MKPKLTSRSMQKIEKGESKKLFEKYRILEKHKIKEGAEKLEKAIEK